MIAQTDSAETVLIGLLGAAAVVAINMLRGGEGWDWLKFWKLFSKRAIDVLQPNEKPREDDTKRLEDYIKDITGKASADLNDAPLGAVVRQYLNRETKWEVLRAGRDKGAK